MTPNPFLTAAAALAVLLTVVAFVLGSEAGAVALTSALAVAHLAASADAARAFVVQAGLGNDAGVRVAGFRLVTLQLLGLLAIGTLASSIGAGPVAVGWLVWPLGGICAAGVAALRDADARSMFSAPTLSSQEVAW